VDDGPPALQDELISPRRYEADMASHLVDWRQPVPEVCRGGAVAVGNYDGAHLGHASLIAELVWQARRAGGPSVALTFDPHPLSLLRPDQPLSLLTTPADRGDLLHRLGADQVLTLRVEPSLLALSAASFFERVLREGLAARAVVEGTNFGFGHGREGNIDTLAGLCRQAGMELSVVPPLVLDGVEVSSSRIRGELLRGDVTEAARLLGRFYHLRGEVVVGERRGRALGFPTANLERVATVVPGDGVYAVRVRDPEGRRWPGAANVGPNPTFAQQERKIEAHLIGFEGDLYGRELAVEFVRRLRDTRKFSGKEELIAQMRLDIEQARRSAGEAR
jgi:riboflavin kinase/FMN adenylyltransferase